MKWFLLLQVIASWPSSPAQVQVFGPIDEKSVCLDTQQQIMAQLDHVKAMCISVPQGAPAPQAPAAK